jgi:inner membrane protein
MDNLTHSLVGLAAAKAGFERLSPRATAICILAANAPDSDIVWLIFGDRWSFLQNHRGITHSILGTLCLALALPILITAIEWALSRLRGKQLEINLAGLWVASTIVSATHPLMDWTNNYGIRPLLPWNPQWFYGDLVFVVDPFLWLLFGGASFLLTSRTRLQRVAWSALGLIITLFVMLGSMQRRALSDPLMVRVFWITALICIFLLYATNAAKRWGRKIAIASFLVLLAYWGSLAYVHNLALRRAGEQASLLAHGNGETIGKLAAMPTLANPLNWECVFETDRATYRFDVSLTGSASAAGAVRYERPSPETTPLVETASQDKRAQVLLGFARFPVIKVADTSCTIQTLVSFADLRYTEPGKLRGTFALEVPVDCPVRNEQR